MTNKIRLHLPLLLMGMFSLIIAMLAGLMRLGWGLPPVMWGLSVLHGPLMVSGFLGTLIGLERAVALGRGWTYLAPLLTGSGAIILLINRQSVIGPLLMILGSLCLVSIFFVIFRMQPVLHTIIMGMGAFSWFTGNILWFLGIPVHQVVLWWIGFLVLTIAGERLELTRMLQPSGVSRIYFLLTILIFLSGIVLTRVTFDIGVRITGVGMIFLSLWLFRYDIARRTIRQTGLPRFIAFCLLSGYVWLLFSGLMALRYGGVIAGPHYDAILHSIFLGFIFVMIFGHAPIIFPAVLGVSITFHPRFYIHLILLHISLILRITGDIMGWLPGRQWGGMLNVLAILLFFVNTMSATSMQTSKGSGNTIGYKHLISFLTVLMTLLYLAGCSKEEGAKSRVVSIPEVPAEYSGKHMPAGWWTDDKIINAGRILYSGEKGIDVNCADCHGLNGEPILPFARDLRDASIIDKWSDSYWFWRISEGVPGTAMTSWKGRLSEEMIWQIIAYARTFSHRGKTAGRKH